MVGTTLHLGNEPSLSSLVPTIRCLFLLMVGIDPPGQLPRADRGKQEITTATAIVTTNSSRYCYGNRCHDVWHSLTLITIITKIATIGWRVSKIDVSPWSYTQLRPLRNFWRKLRGVFMAVNSFMAMQKHPWVLQSDQFILGENLSNAVMPLSIINILLVVQLHQVGGWHVPSHGRWFSGARVKVFRHLWIYDTFIDKIGVPISYATTMPNIFLVVYPLLFINGRGLKPPLFSRVP